MMNWRWWSRLQALLRREMLHLATVNRSDRRWQMPFCAALASGLPLLVGVHFDRLDYGLVSSPRGAGSISTASTCARSIPAR